MKIRRICEIYFSPTKSTEGILDILNEHLGIQGEKINLTSFTQNQVRLNLDKDDIAIFAFPVYSGRVPETFKERLKDIKGNNTCAVLIATYGNREYDDSILEMKNIAEENGFEVIAAAAVVTEHSVRRSVGKGRPDADDINFLKDFSDKLINKINHIDYSKRRNGINVKGNYPYRKYIKVPMTPKTSDKCVKCGICKKECPVNAIDFNDDINTDKNKCIGCMRCVRKCPQNARYIPKIKMIIGNSILSKNKKIRKSPEFFI